MSLKVAHVNVRSLPAHFGGVSALLASHHFDILALSETWLTQDMPDSVFGISGYTLLRSDRRHRGGGGNIL